MSDGIQNVNEKYLQSIRKILNRELQKLESLDVEFIDIDELEQRLENTIRKYEV